MEMEMIQRLKKLLCKQLEGYVDVKAISGKGLEDVASLVKTIKNLDLIAGMAEDDGYSQAGASYRRGRGMNGRYVSRDDGSRRGGGSYRSYDDERGQMADHLSSMMHSTHDPEVKNAIMDCLEKIEHM